jgi:hypothetical protein
VQRLTLEQWPFPLSGAPCRTVHWPQPRRLRRAHWRRPAAEMFTGQSVLGDLQRVPGSHALRVLVRYVALRAVMLTDPVLAEVERPAARPYLALLPGADPERRALTRALDLVKGGTGPEVAAALADAAAEATAWAHLLGARSLARAAFVMAGRRATNLQVRCTQLLTRISTALRDPRDAALWRRREAVLRRRSDKDGGG